MLIFLRSKPIKCQQIQISVFKFKIVPTAPENELFCPRQLAIPLKANLQPYPENSLKKTTKKNCTGIEFIISLSASKYNNTSTKYKLV